ncbi:unnamed protein product [Peniophora sp. CBMAI 1063]|nr:unnamed protein product [Peniophora sp. CBMAI 1063]
MFLLTIVIVNACFPRCESSCGTSSGCVLCNISCRTRHMGDSVGRQALPNEDNKNTAIQVNTVPLCATIISTLPMSVVSKAY